MLKKYETMWKWTILVALNRDRMVRICPILLHDIDHNNDDDVDVKKWLMQSSF